MFKLIKYEIKRNAFLVSVIFIIMAIFQAITILGVVIDKEVCAIIGRVLVSFTGGLGVFILLFSSSTSFSKELGSRESYMTFMTPVSSYKIIGAKLITTGILVAFTDIFVSIVNKLNGVLFTNTFEDYVQSTNTIKILLESMGYDLKELIIYLFVALLITCIVLYTIMCLSYLSITLTATVLANKRGRFIISLVLFFLIIIGLGFLLWDRFPTADIGSGVINTILAPLYYYIAFFAIMISSFFASGYLLDKKISL